MSTATINPVRLDLGCGQRPAAGFAGVDMYHPAAEYRFNLLRFPWPLETGSVDELRSSHFVEHIPACYVSGSSIPQDESDIDLWCAFFAECWRVLKDGGEMHVIVPYLKSHRAFQDPTHRRFLCEASFNYLNRAWRVRHGLNHYLGDSDFDILEAKCASTAIESAFSSEDAGQRSLYLWDTLLDMSVRMVARKARV